MGRWYEWQPCGYGRDVLVAALTFAAGLIDALSFLALGGVFSSFMSGNTVLLGLRIGLGDFPLALNSMVAILGYIAGVALGTNIGYQSSRSDKIWPYAVTKILSAEFIIITIFTRIYRWKIRLWGRISSDSSCFRFHGNAGYSGSWFRHLRGDLHIRYRHMD